MDDHIIVICLPKAGNLDGDRDSATTVGGLLKEQVVKKKDTRTALRATPFISRVCHVVHKQSLVDVLHTVDVPLYKSEAAEEKKTFLGIKGTKKKDMASMHQKRQRVLTPCAR